MEARTNKMFPGSDEVVKKQKLNDIQAKVTCKGERSHDDEFKKNEYATPEEDKKARENFVYKPDQRHRFVEDVDCNRLTFDCFKTLTNIPFLKAQPGGMPCWIDRIDDIRKLSKQEVVVFLRGYEQSTDGTLDELKMQLACVLGISREVAVKEFCPSLWNEYFIPAYPAKDDEFKKNEYATPEEDKKARENFVYKPDQRHRFVEDVDCNRLTFDCFKTLTNIPFLKAQPGGMPCWIDRIDDIRKLSKQEVVVFLRGYEQSTDGTLDELKLQLACVLGISRDVASKAFRRKNNKNL